MLSPSKLSLCHTPGRTIKRVKRNLSGRFLQFEAPDHANRSARTHARLIGHPPGFSDENGRDHDGTDREKTLLENLTGLTEFFDENCERLFGGTVRSMNGSNAQRVWRNGERF